MIWVDFDEGGRVGFEVVRVLPVCKSINKEEGSETFGLFFSQYRKDQHIEYNVS